MDKMKDIKKLVHDGKEGKLEFKDLARDFFLSFAYLHRDEVKEASDLGKRFVDDCVPSLSSYDILRKADKGLAIEDFKLDIVTKVEGGHQMTLEHYLFPIGKTGQTKYDNYFDAKNSKPAASKDKKARDTNLDSAEV